jgi:hypothetical protein
MARMTIELPDDIVKIVAKSAEKESIPKTEVIRRWFGVLRAVQQERDRDLGNDLGIVNGDKVVARFVNVV